MLISYEKTTTIVTKVTIDNQTTFHGWYMCFYAKGDFFGAKARWLSEVFSKPKNWGRKPSNQQRKRNIVPKIIEDRHQTLANQQQSCSSSSPMVLSTSSIRLKDPRFVYFDKFTFCVSVLFNMFLASNSLIFDCNV